MAGAPGRGRQRDGAAPLPLTEEAATDSVVTGSPWC
jgi:hypothetical protein